MGDAPGHDGGSQASPPFLERFKHLLFGAPRDLTDRRIFHRLSVVAFLAWVGLGADGLSSSAYGPEEAFRTLGAHTYLAVPIAVLMITTVFIISACYSRLIDRFPHGGGGYVVATALLGERAGVVSGSALLVDYVLTITVSIAAAGDAMFSFLPLDWHELKLPAEIVLILGLVTINIRGVKESILILMPVFILFLATHAVLIGGGILAHADALGDAAREVHQGFRMGLSSLGVGGMLLLLVHAYSLGGGTYTGIEAVSNGLPIMRQPRVRTAKRTMVYMATSLALTASGLTLCYLLWKVSVTPGKTLNAVLAEQVASSLALGAGFKILTLLSEGMLLVVAAQAGFIDGPRVLANMAIDSWFPRRFAALSDRLTTRNGIVLMGGTALAAILYTKGDVRHIVVMYSINVFLTFSLSMLGMVHSLWQQRRRKGFSWRRPFLLFALGLIFCVTILAITVVAKFGEGGWITLAATGTVVLFCFWVRRHYQIVTAKLAALYASLAQMPRIPEKALAPLDASQPTAAVLVGSYSGLGIHTTLAAFRAFPGQFKNVVFLSAGVIDSGAFKGEDSLDRLREQTAGDLQKYKELVESRGVPATYRMAIGTDVVSELEQLCLEAAKEFPQITFVAGQLIFQRERWYQAILHNETAFALQRRLQVAGHTIVILPARVE
ncbi:MAG: APC family permease [Planctomycetes bacterium]|nr:APC family permease [Planctomycetota bacterium]